MIRALVVVVLVGLCVLRGCSEIQADKEYERTVSSYWDLSERASTLDMKAAYLDQFVAAVDSAHLSGHDAILYPTPQNDVALNIETLKSLRSRLEQIRHMDVQSFQYQQAISQITAQEQGEASAMLGVIEGRWYLSHHPLLWDWVGGLTWLALVGPIVTIGLVVLVEA